MSTLGLNVIVCGPTGASGVTYVEAGGQPVGCGTDASGNALQLQVDTATVASDQPGGASGDGAVVGLAVGGAVLGVMAIAYGFRLLRNFINSSSEG